MGRGHPGGAYAGSREAADRIGWVFDSPTEHFTFEQFTNAFQRPDIMRRRLAGEDIDAPIAVRRPPHVAITSSTVVGDRAKLHVAFGGSERVTAVRAFVEGRSEAVLPVCKASGEADLEVPLKNGVDRISVIGFDDDGFASNAATLDTTLASGGKRGDIWVVAVGVSKYPLLDAGAQLPAARGDAESLARAFADLAGPNKAYAASHVNVLVDEAATPTAIEAALAGLAKMKPDDVAIVAFAGHGLKVRPSEEMRFVTGTVRSGPHGIDPSSVAAASLGWGALGRALHDARGRVLLLLDACHSGAVSEELVVPNDAAARDLARDGRAGVVVFAAAKGRQLSYEPSNARGLGFGRDGEAPEPPRDGIGYDRGYFTGAILASLADAKADRNKDGALQLSELVASVTARVSKATGGRQTPYVARSELFGDFTVAPSAKP